MSAHDCFSDWHRDSRATTSRVHMPCRAHISRASSTRCSRRQCNREFGSAHAVAPIHHGERSVLLEMSATKSVRPSTPIRWSDRSEATTPSNTCSLKLMVWHGRVSLATCLIYLSKGTGCGLSRATTIARTSSTACAAATSDRVAHIQASLRDQKASGVHLHVRKRLSQLFENTCAPNRFARRARGCASTSRKRSRR